MVTVKKKTTISTLIDTIDDFLKTDNPLVGTDNAHLQTCLETLKQELLAERVNRKALALESGVFVPLEQI